MSYKIAFLDFETQSPCDLKAHGAYLYASHPKTTWLCAAIAFDDEPAFLYRPGDDISALIRHVENGGLIVGHNITGFDQFIWEFVWKLPAIPVAQIHDTMSMSYAMSLPGGLDGAAQAMGLAHQKDVKASRVMLQLAQPRADGSFYTRELVPEKFEILDKYAISDIEATRELYYRLMKITGPERKVFELDMKINERGIPVDISGIETALAIVDREQIRLRSEMQKVSNNQIASPQAVSQILEFARNRIPEIQSLAKNDVKTLLARTDIPGDLRRVLEIRQEAAKSSTAKLKKMKDTAASDHRIRGTLQYHGASTGRWAGRGAQFQNFPKGKYDEQFWKDLADLRVESFYHSPLDTISRSLRGFLKSSSGKKFIGADFSQIEARVLPWLAGETSVLDVFRSGQDIYKMAASQIYGIPVSRITEAQRFVGKVAVLALGYGGGKAAFAKMAANYGASISEDESESIKAGWRAANLRIVSFWYALEDSAIRAVLKPGTNFVTRLKTPRVTWRKQGSFLWCQLPSGRCLCYPYPEIKTITTPWGAEKNALTFMSVNGLTKKWERQKTYGGSLAENVTQAVARDVMANSMLELEENGYPVILTVHDEILCEVGFEDNRSLAEFERMMTETLPVWVAGLPIKAEAWTSGRYSK